MIKKSGKNRTFCYANVPNVLLSTRASAGAMARTPFRGFQHPQPARRLRQHVVSPLGFKAKSGQKETRARMGGRR